MKPVTFEDVMAAMTPAEAKLIRDGAAVFVGPVKDPQDDEKLIDETPPE